MIRKILLFILLPTVILAQTDKNKQGTKNVPKSIPPVSVTNNAAPFSFNATTQTLNIPKTASLVDNGDGTITLNKGDGTSVTVGAADDKTNAAITVNGVTYAAGTSFETLIAALNANSHPTASVTNNAAPFSFNATTQALNIPKQNKLEDNGNGTMKFTRGDGSGFDSVQVYLIPEPLFVAKYKAATETLLNNMQTIGYTQGGISKTLETKANIILIDDTAPATQTINIPNPALVANAGFEFQIFWGKTPNKVTFNYPIYDRILGTLYSSTTFVPDTRDFMTLPKLYTTDILFKSFAYKAYHIVNTNGKYFIVNR